MHHGPPWNPNQQQPPHYGYGYGPPPPPAPQVIYVQQRMMKPPFSHTGHVVLDVLTCGAWLPFHLVLWACH